MHCPAPCIPHFLRGLHLFLFPGRQASQRIRQLPSATSLTCLCVFTLAFPIQPPQRMAPSTWLMDPILSSVSHLHLIDCPLPKKKIHLTLFREKRVPPRRCVVEARHPPCHPRSLHRLPDAPNRLRVQAEGVAHALQERR